MRTIDNTVVHQFVKWVEEKPENEAIFIGSISYSYRELSRISAAIKNRIEAQGYSAEKFIGILTIDDIYTYAAILAILSLGAAYVPINNKNPVKRNQDIIDDTDLQIALASVKHQELTDVSGNIHIMDISQIEPVEKILEVNAISEDDFAYIFFTSGSTGKPKGVPIHHYNLNAFMNVMMDTSDYHFDETDRFLQMYELTFDLSVTSYLLPLCIGASCYVVPQKGIFYLNIMNLVRDHKLTVLQMVPSVLSYIERFMAELDFPDVKYSIFCGEPLTNSVLFDWQKVTPNGKILNLYGPTEATIYCFRYDWDPNLPDQDVVNGIVSIGHPFNGVDFCILDTDNERVTQSGSKGELCISGKQVTSGYWNNPEKTAAAFNNLKENLSSARYYRTGDLVSMNALGNVIYHGRIDHQVKIDGHRIELGEVEYHVRNFYETPMAAAKLMLDPDANKEILVVFIETEEDRTKNNLISYLSDYLPPYMIPKRVVYLDSMPLNLNGKIDRNSLHLD